MYFRNVQSIHVRIIFHSHDCITSDYHPAQPPSISLPYPPSPSLHPAAERTLNFEPSVDSAFSVGNYPRAVSTPQHNPFSAEDRRR